LARPRVEGVHTTLGRIGVEPGRVVTKARQDARGAGEGDVAREAQAARPAGQRADRREALSNPDTDLAVAAVAHPQTAAVQARRVRAGEATQRDLARLAGEDDTGSVDTKVHVAGSAARDDVGRCREVRTRQARAGGD